MRPLKLNAADLQSALLALNAELAAPWFLTDGKLCKRFKFADFRAAFAFMTQVADDANRLDHHPEWLNVYNTVDVALMTHDAKGITVLDFALARCMEAAAAG